MSNSKPRTRPGDAGPDTSPAPGIEGTQTSGDTPAGPGARRAVGDELRMRREELGHNIGDVVDAVRIQKRYLEALEEGRNGDLPGTVYALGFVRTYADFLGLNGSDIVARYKEETQNFNVDTSLVLPEPIDEGKSPKLMILLLAVVLSAVAYGAWYFLAQKDGGVVEVVPEVPERFAGLIEEEQPAAEPRIVVPPEETAPPVESLPPPVTAAPAEAAAATGSAPPEIPAEPAEPVTPPEPETVEPAPPPLAETPVAPPLLPSAGETEILPAPPPQTAPEREVAATTDEPPSIEREPLPPPVFSPAPAPGAGEPPVAPLDLANRDPRVYGLANANARIVIHALEDSWVEVSDTEGVLLFSRVLRKGDSYRVANQQGATFVTGNAGGLELRVDGQVTPPIGPAGVVRRNVRLEPDLLKAGTAVP